MSKQTCSVCGINTMDPGYGGTTIGVMGDRYSVTHTRCRDNVMQLDNVIETRQQIDLLLKTWLHGITFPTVFHKFDRATIEGEVANPHAINLFIDGAADYYRIKFNHGDDMSIVWCVGETMRAVTARVYGYALDAADDECERMAEKEREYQQRRA